MTDAIAISAVTKFLQTQLDEVFSDSGGVEVKTFPLDRAAEGNQGGGRVNLFLYHAEVNPHWRNHDLPWRTNPNEGGRPALALNLYYLITAYYGNDDESVENNGTLSGTHYLMGQAMSLFHDNRSMNRKNIQDALPNDIRLQHPFDQIENIRISPQPLSTDEMSKIWTTFQTQYRFSFAYEVSVVFIESQKLPLTPLPVLKRGSDDQGVLSQADILSPFPTLTEIKVPKNQPAVELGDTISLLGYNLMGNNKRIELVHSTLDLTFSVDSFSKETDKELELIIPADATDWSPGVYMVSVHIDVPDDQTRVTNQLPLFLSPQVQARNVIATPNRDDCKAILTITCQPEVRPAQTIMALLGSRAIRAESFANKTNEIRFCVPNAVPAGDYIVRLRIDGVDNLVINYEAKPLAFKANQKVTIP